MVHQKIVLFIVLLFGAIHADGVSAAENQPSEIETQSFILGPIHLDKIYPAMTGPIKQQSVNLGNASDGSSLWIRSYRVDILDDKGAGESSRYLCHAWAQIGLENDDQLLSISQGMKEMALPDGYALKVPNQPDNMFLLVQALNDDPNTDKELQFKTTLNYLGDADAKKLGLKALRQVMIFVEDKTSRADDSMAMSGMGGMPMPPMPVPQGSRKTVHSVMFYVPPGRHEYRVLIEKDDPFYTQAGTIHFIKLHLHAYGVSMSLIDKTTGNELWKGWGVTDTQQTALTKTDFYSSSEGIKIDPSHDYEVVAIYDNTTQKPVDAMAVLRLYVADE